MQREGERQRQRWGGVRARERETPYRHRSGCTCTPSSVTRKLSGHLLPGNTTASKARVSTSSSPESIKLHRAPSTAHPLDTHRCQMGTGIDPAAELPENKSTVWPQCGDVKETVTHVEQIGGINRIVNVRLPRCPPHERNSANPVVQRDCSLNHHQYECCKHRHSGTQVQIMVQTWHEFDCWQNQW
jgi:hypothetical protein